MTTPITPSTAVVSLTEDEMLTLVTRASALQQAGETERAVELYQELLLADPKGRYGDLARRSLQSLLGDRMGEGGVASPGVGLMDPPTTVEPELTSPPTQGLLGGASAAPGVPAQPLRSLPRSLRNLPIRQKQTIGLLTSQVVSIVGLVGVGAVLIVTGLRSQLVQQARSEVAVMGINYNIKVDQMGFGFRGQSDNTAVISAAVTGKNSPQVTKILQNEIKAREIEYATLVDRQFRIISSANAPRAGEIFNPGNLVATAIDQGKQIKATDVVPWADLAKEKPPLPPGVEGQDALVRYTATPVRNPGNGQIVGALVSGDIVNGKIPIVERTVQAFGDGYSGIYFRNSQNQWQLATSLYQQEGEPQPKIDVPDLSLLDQALKQPDEPVADRLELNDRSYTFVAKTLTNYQGTPLAVLVRGTSEDTINQLLRTSLTWQGTTTLLVLVLNLVIATLLTRSIAGPIRRLQQSAQKLAAGDQTSRADVVSADEVGQLAQTFNQMADSIQNRTHEVETLAAQQKAEAEYQRRQTERLQRRVIELLLEIEGAQKGDLTIRANVTDDEMGSVADAFNATVTSLRQLVTQVQQVADQMNASATDSDQSVTELSQQALQQAEAIATVLRSVEEMSRSIESVAHSAQSAAAIAKEASSAATLGGSAMEQTVESIEALRGNVAETAKKVKRLTESSQEISKIVALISEISAKTNLLAFNASIEAVRAGEHGQGFRIVADEVRRLAERVSDSTKEIEQLVSGIQLETAEVLSMMEKGTTQVVTSTRLVADTRKTLLALVNTSQQIDQLVQTISESTASQNLMSQEVSHTMKAVAEVAQTTSTESQQVSESLKHLREVSTDLQSSVSRFRVD